MNKITSLGISAAVLALAGVPFVAHADDGNGNGHTPVAVCHVQGNGEYHAIVIDDDALDMHLGHGDVPVPGEGCESLNPEAPVEEPETPVDPPVEENPEPPVEEPETPVDPPVEEPVTPDPKPETPDNPKPETPKPGHDGKPDPKPETPSNPDKPGTDKPDRTKPGKPGKPAGPVTVADPPLQVVVPVAGVPSNAVAVPVTASAPSSRADVLAGLPAATHDNGKGHGKGDGKGKGRKHRKVILPNTGAGENVLMATGGVAAIAAGAFLMRRPRRTQA